MTATADGDTETPLPITYDVPDDVDVDEEAVKILAVYWGVTLTLHMIHEALAENNPPENLTQDHIDTLEAAFRTGQRLLDHDAYEAFLAEGPSALPEDLVDEIEETLAPVASAYGIELEGAGDEFTLADHFTTDIGWRGS